jgi:hypothetical protein
MKLPKNCIEYICYKGRPSLAVGDLAFINSMNGLVIDETRYTEFPDGWFCRLTSSGYYYRPCIEREQGCLFLTRAGWEANKETIKKSFDRAIAEGRQAYLGAKQIAYRNKQNLRGIYGTSTEIASWQSYLEFVDQHFKMIAEEIDKYETKLSRDYNTKIADLKKSRLNY